MACGSQCHQVRRLYDLAFNAATKRNPVLLIAEKKEPLILLCLLCDQRRSTITYIYTEHRPNVSSPGGLMDRLQ